MKVTLNGEAREIEARDAQALLDELGLRREVVVVERNEEIIARDALAEVSLEEGDRIEIIRMIAGG